MKWRMLTLLSSYYTALKGNKLYYSDAYKWNLQLYIVILQSNHDPSFDR